MPPASVDDLALGIEEEVTVCSHTRPTESVMLMRVTAPPPILLATSAVGAAVGSPNRLAWGGVAGWVVEPKELCAVLVAATSAAGLCGEGGIVAEAPPVRGTRCTRSPPRMPFASSVDPRLRKSFLFRDRQKSARDISSSADSSSLAIKLPTESVFSASTLSVPPSMVRTRSFIVSRGCYICVI
jgi:hypothetical protein